VLADSLRCFDGQVLLADTAETWRVEWFFSAFDIAGADDGGGAFEEAGV